MLHVTEYLLKMNMPYSSEEKSEWESLCPERNCVKYVIEICTRSYHLWPTLSLDLWGYKWQGLLFCFCLFFLLWSFLFFVVMLFLFFVVLFLFCFVDFFCFSFFAKNTVKPQWMNVWSCTKYKTLVVIWMYMDQWLYEIK